MRGKVLTDFKDFWITSNILTLEILSCIAILYCGFIICKTFITKMLKAMNPQKTTPSKYTVISEGFEVSNSEYHSVFIISKVVTLTCVSSYGKHVCILLIANKFYRYYLYQYRYCYRIRWVSLIHFADVPILPLYRLESIMLQNVLIMLSSIFPIFCLLCSF